MEITRLYDCALSAASIPAPVPPLFVLITGPAPCDHRGRGGGGPRVVCGSEDRLLCRKVPEPLEIYLACYINMWMGGCRSISIGRCGWGLKSADEKRTNEI